MKPLHIISTVLAILVVNGCAKSQETNGEMQKTSSAEESAAAKAPSLDGKVFIVDFYDPGKAEPSKDTLSFTDGAFHSIDCDEYGFTAANYTASADGERVAFSASTTSDAEGRMDWKGTVTGDKIEGTVIWTKKGQDAINYHYSGVLQ